MSCWINQDVMRTSNCILSQTHFSPTLLFSLSLKFIYFTWITLKFGELINTSQRDGCWHLGRKTEYLEKTTDGPGENYWWAWWKLLMGLEKTTDGPGENYWWAWRKLLIGLERTTDAPGKNYWWAGENYWWAWRRLLMGLEKITDGPGENYWWAWRKLLMGLVKTTDGPGENYWWARRKLLMGLEKTTDRSGENYWWATTTFSLADQNRYLCKQYRSRWAVSSGPTLFAIQLLVLYLNLYSYGPVNTVKVMSSPSVDQFFSWQSLSSKNISLNH